MKAADLGALVLLAALWGGSFLFMRIAAPALGPLVVAAARVLLAATALLIYAAALRRVPSLRARWKSYAVMGTLNAAVPFTLISAAELHLTASLAAILNATTPLFTAVVAAIWMKDRLTPAKGIGLLLGIAGVAVLVGWSPMPLGPVIILSIGASLIAAVFYGLAGVYARHTFAGIAPLELAIGQQMGAGLLLLPLAVPAAAISAPSMQFTAGVIAAMLGLALLSTSVAYLLYFRLIANVGPTKTLSVTLLVPIFGVLWGTIFLHESVGASTLAGMAIILSSVLLITGMRLRPPLAANRVGIHRWRMKRPAA